MANIPDMQVPQYVTTSAAFAIEAAIKDAIRLGLTWRLRPGTVGGIGAADPESVPVTIDGDNAPLLARSMVGSVALGQRVWCIQVPPAGTYVLGRIGRSALAPTQRTITAASSTWTHPAGLAWIDAEGCGGGGAGGGAAVTAAGQAAMGGGGGGGCAGRGILPAALLPSSLTVTIGAAGVGAAGAAGGAGGTTSFGGLVTFNGGSGGAARVASAVANGVEGGAGGATLAGTLASSFTLAGGDGGDTGWGDINGLGISGGGGGSNLGGGGIGRRTNGAGQSLAGGTGRNYGGGGGGSCNSGGSAALAGGSGGPGVMIVTEYFM